MNKKSIETVLTGRAEKATEFLKWFEQEFEDDVGEPAFLLYAALAYHRMGSLEKARRYLLDAMLSNIYLLPYLFSRPLPKQDMWHSSNWAQPDYIEEIEELLEEPTIQEREWIKGQFEGERFTNVRNKYIETFRALQHADDFDTRSSILGITSHSSSFCTSPTSVDTHLAV